MPPCPHLQYVSSAHLIQPQKIIRFSLGYTGQEITFHLHQQENNNFLFSYYTDFIKFYCQIFYQGKLQITKNHQGTPNDFSEGNEKRDKKFSAEIQKQKR